MTNNSPSSAKENAEFLAKKIKLTQQEKPIKAKANADFLAQKMESKLKTKTESLNTAIKSTENWLSQDEMDRVLVKLDDFVRTYTVDRNLYTDTVSLLKERKQLYSTFDSAEAYNAAVKENTYRQMHEGYTKEDVQKAIDRLTTASKLAGIEGETDEVKWLKNYGMNVGYSDVESYDEEIAILDKQLQSAYVSGQQIQYGDNGFSYIYYTNQKYIDELESKKGLLERKKKILEAEIKEKEYDLHRGDTQFETIAAQGNYLGFYDDKKIEHMTDDQKEMFNYLANKFNLEEADKYLNDISPFLNEKINEEKTKRAQNFSDKFPGLSDILTLGSQLIDGTIMAPVKFIGSITGDYEKNWASYDSLTTFTNTIRTDHAQDLSNFFGTEWAGFVYNTVMSIADMGTALAVGGAVGKIAGVASSTANTTNIAKGVTQFIMSSEAASQTMTDARQRGLSGIQIAALGVASGTIEALTEKLPLDNLFGAKPNYIKSVVKQIATEGTEEAISNVANTILDEIIAGNQSALKQQIGDLMASGMSYQDAANKVLIEKAKEVGMDALAGALSGAVMGGGSVALNKLSTVHFSIPTKYKGDLSSAQTWVADKFQNLKNSTNKKGLGTVVVDSQTMTDAIHKTETADKALTFAAINDIIHKGKVELKEDGNAAAIGTVATLNGNTHSVVLTASKMNNGNFLVTGIALDGDAVIYDARNYLQQMAESAMEQSASVENNTKYAVLTDVSGEKFVDVQEDIFDDTNGRSVASVIAEILSVRFNNLVNANGQNIQVNSITNGEWRKSNSARELLETEPSVYDDKLKAIANADEILQEAKGWIGEKLGHERTDNIIEFARGNILYRVGENGYSADVIVGIRNGGGAVLYDIVNISHKEITEAPVSRANAERHPSRQNASVTGVSLSQDEAVVNSQLLQSDSQENEKIDYSILELEQTELDVSFLEMNEEERADFAQRFESATGTRVVFDETINAGGKYKDGVITVNPNKDTPMTVLIHELTHHIEKHPKYADFFEYVFKSEMFASWLKEKGTTLQNMRRATVALRAREGHPLGASGDVTYEADQEILGYFLGQKVFRDMNVLSELAQRHRGFFEWIRDFIANIVQYFRNTPMERELNRMQKMFSKVLHQKTKGNPAAGQRKVKFSFGVTQFDIDEYVDKATLKENTEDIKRYAEPTEKLINEVSGEIDLNGYTHALRDNDIRHIYNSHGENTNEKYPVTNEDIKLIPDIVENYDKVFVKTNSRGKPGIVYVKVAANNVVYYVEAVTQEYHNEKLLINKQMIKTGIDEIPNLYGLIDAINKKESSSQYLADLQEIRKAYVQDVKESYSINDIEPQSAENVNTQYMQDDTKYSVSPVLDAEETVQGQSNLPETSGQTTVEQATDEQLFEEIRRRHPQLSPIDIARLKPEDAVTTPTIRNSTVRNVTGDGDSLFYDNLQNADIFNEELKTLAASNSTIMQYDRIGNQETLRAANNEINRKGRRYVGEFLHKESTEFTAQDVAAGFILMGRYNAVGDNRGAVMIAEKLREVGTKSGQTVQAFSILGRLTPEGMQLYAQRELHKAYETMLKEQTNKWGRENKDKFKLTDEDIEFIRRKVVQAAQLPDGRDKYVRLGEIAARIQSKIPQQKGQGIKAFQRTMLLLNPKTQIRNIVGNFLMTPEFIASDFIGTGIDKAISKATGVRTTGISLSAKAFAEGLFNSWDDFVRHINTRIFENGRFEIEGHSLDNFSDRNAFTRALNTLDRVTSFLLDAGDRSFYQMWFINSLNAQMKANHVTEPTAAMIEIAMQDAKERTWQDDNAFTKTLSVMKDGLNRMSIKGYGLGDVMFKFLKTPANITKAMIDFSPTGLGITLAFEARKFSEAVKEGRVTPQMQRNFVKHLANGITGTIVSALGYLLARLGLLSGKKDEDKDVADFERNVLGIQPYSFKIGNKSITYDWANPATTSFAIWADYFEDKRNAELTGEKREWHQNVIEAIRTGGQVLFNQSFMTSLRNLYGYDGPMDGIINILLQDPSAFMPQALSQIAATIDPKVRNTIESDNDVKTGINKILYKLPGARNTLAESVDVMGNTKMQQGSIWNRIFNNFLNPANVAKGYDSAAADEVYRLYQVTGSSSVIPSQAPNYVEVPNGGKRTLNSYEKADYQKATGKMITEAVDKLLANERYRGLSDDTKVELLGKVYSYSKQSANSEVLGIEMNESAIKAHDVISQGLPLYEYFLLKQVADENDNGAISQEEARAALDASGLTKTQKSIMWKAFNSGWKSNPYGKRYY